MPMNIKFFFKKSVHGTVQVEGKTRWARGPEDIVDIETAWAFNKEVDFRAREAPIGAAIVPFCVAVGFVELAHGCSVSLTLPCS